MFEFAKSYAPPTAGPSVRRVNEASEGGIRLDVQANGFKFLTSARGHGKIRYALKGERCGPE